MSAADSRANAYASQIDEARNLAKAGDLYADALRRYGPAGCNWQTINGAVLARWSRSSLEKIKRAAWSALKCDHAFESNPGMYDTMHRYCTKCGVVEGARP